MKVLVRPVQTEDMSTLRYGGSCCCRYKGEEQPEPSEEPTAWRRSHRLNMVGGLDQAKRGERRGRRRKTEREKERGDQESRWLK